jgi:hypothetical protein
MMRSKNMKANRAFLAAVAAGVIAVAPAGVATAHDTQGGMGRGTMHQRMGPGMAHHGMGPGMMHQRMGPGMAHHGMGPGMMHQRMGPGMMMGPGGMGPHGGAVFGRRVVPLMNLSVEDVRGYLDWRLSRLGNKRLKVGEVKAEDGTITADIVTVDDSLVQRLKVDRRTGAIEYEN